MINLLLSPLSHLVLSIPVARLRLSFALSRTNKVAKSDLGHLLRQLFHPIGLTDLGRTNLTHIVRINEKPDTVAIHSPLRAANWRRTADMLLNLTTANCLLKGKAHVFHRA